MPTAVTQEDFPAYFDNPFTINVFKNRKIGQKSGKYSFFPPKKSYGLLVLPLFGVEQDDSVAIRKQR